MLQCNLTKSDESTFFILYVDWVLCEILVLPYINVKAKRSAEWILMLFIHFSLSFPDTSGASETTQFFIRNYCFLTDKSLF